MKNVIYYYFQTVDLLLPRRVELLAGTLSRDAISRLADGFGSAGRIAGRHQKLGDVPFLRWLSRPHIQSFFGL